MSHPNTVTRSTIIGRCPPNERSIDSQRQRTYSSSSSDGRGVNWNLFGDGGDERVFAQVFLGFGILTTNKLDEMSFGSDEKFFTNLFVLDF